MITIITNFNYGLILEIYNLGFIFVFSFALHFFLFIFILKGLAASSLQAKLSYLLNNNYYLLIAVPVLFSILFYLYISNPIYFLDDKVEVTFAIADVKLSSRDASTLLSFVFKGGAFLLGGGVAAAFLKTSKITLFPRLAIVAASGTGMGTSYHAVQNVLNLMTPSIDKEVTIRMTVKVAANNNLLEQGHFKNLVSKSLETGFTNLELSTVAKQDLSVVANSITQVETSPTSDIAAINSLELNVSILEGQEAIDKINNEDVINNPLPSGEALDPTSSAAASPASASRPSPGGSWPASSPLEQGELLEFPHKEEIVNILSLNLILLSLMLYFIFMLFLFITAKLFLDSKIEFNIIKKLPYGTNLHYYFLKYISLLHKVNSVWLYFIICNLFFLNLVVIFCLYNIINIIQPG